MASAAAPASAPAGARPIVNLGPIVLVNGRIDLNDLFVKPNYSADLSELTGKLSAFSSKPQARRPALADLELRGKAQQTAALEITGKLNPLASRSNSTHGQDERTRPAAAVALRVATPATASSAAS